ncbi:MAG: hypothetical protein ACR2OA_21075 [Rubripirellula sp.]|jgi:hypothetical protein
MKPNPRFLRFSLRTLMLLTTVVAVLCALPVHRAYTQKQGRDWVISQNGHISFSYKYDAEKEEWDHDATLPYPNWLVDALGIDFFASVDTVVLDNKEVVDLSPIVDLHNLRCLGIYIEIQDNLDFSPLSQLPHLRSLYLDYTGISLDELERLRTLLPGVQVQSAGHPDS